MSNFVKIYLAASYAALSNIPAWRSNIIANGGSTTESWPEITPPDLSNGISDDVARGVGMLVLQQGQDILDSLALFLCDQSPDSIISAQYALNSGIPVFWACAPAYASFQPGIVIVSSVDDAISRVPWIINQVSGSVNMYAARQALRSKTG